MINNVKVILIETEYKALITMADQDIRTVTDEIHFILHEEMKRRGLIKPEPNQPEGVSNE